MIEYRRWWTSCPKCSASFTVESQGPIPNPSDRVAAPACPYDGVALTHWNGDLMVTPIQEAAAAILQNIGPDPYAHEHLRALRRAIGASCAIKDCDNEHRSSGFCDTHYRQHTRALANEAHTINRRKIA